MFQSHSQLLFYSNGRHENILQIPYLQVQEVIRLPAAQCIEAVESAGIA